MNGDFPELEATCDDDEEYLTGIIDSEQLCQPWIHTNNQNKKGLQKNKELSDFEWRGKDDCGHLEYRSLDSMLIDWLDELKLNEGSYDFTEEIELIETEIKSKERIFDRVLG